MNVQELIDELEKVMDKTLQVELDTCSPYATKEDSQVTGVRVIYNAEDEKVVVVE